MPVASELDGEGVEDVRSEPGNGRPIQPGRPIETEKIKATIGTTANDCGAIGTTELAKSSSESIGRQSDNIAGKHKHPLIAKTEAAAERNVETIAEARCI